MAELKLTERFFHTFSPSRLGKHATMRSTAYRAASVNERLHKRFFHGFSLSQSRLRKRLIPPRVLPSRDGMRLSQVLALRYSCSSYCAPRRSSMVFKVWKMM